MTTALALPTHLSFNSIDAYVQAVAELPRLSAEEEQALAWRLYRDGDVAAARSLILANLRFVAHIARGYGGYGLPLSDLIQEGNIGLMKAVKRFDPGLGVRLVSFAVHWIRAEIHEFIIQNWRIVKIATTKAQRKLFFNLRKSKSHLGWLSGDEARALADDLGVKLEAVYEMEARLSGRDLALDPLNEDEDEDSSFAPIHYLQHADADPAECLESIEWSEHQRAELRRAIEGLDARSRQILEARWLQDGEKSTLHELAARFSVSAERIRQLEKSALEKLKTDLTLAM